MDQYVYNRNWIVVRFVDLSQAHSVRLVCVVVLSVLQAVSSNSVDRPSSVKCFTMWIMFIFCNFCLKMCESCCFFSLVSHCQLVCYRLPCRWARTFIFFSTDSISDFRCESLGSFTFFVSCLVLSRSNARELDRLYYFAFSNDSLDFTLDLFESFNKCATSVGHEIY